MSGRDVLSDDGKKAPVRATGGKTPGDSSVNYNL